MDISQAVAVRFWWNLYKMKFNMSVWLSAKLSFQKICGTEIWWDQGFAKWSFFSRKFKSKGICRMEMRLHPRMVISKCCEERIRASQAACSPMCQISKLLMHKFGFVQKLDMSQILEKVIAASMLWPPGRPCRGPTSWRMFTPPMVRDQFHLLVKTVEAKPCLVEQYFTVGRGKTWNCVIKQICKFQKHKWTYLGL